jgi:hypothetical protein
LLASYPPPIKDFFTAVPFAAGGDADVYLAQKYCGPVFASDVPPAMASVMAAAQRPITGSALNEKAPSAEGWKTIPSWYVVGDADNVIPPPLQMMMAQRAKAHITFASEHDSAPGSDGSRNPRCGRGDPNLRRCEVASMPCRAGHVPCP